MISARLTRTGALAALALLLCVPALAACQTGSGASSASGASGGGSNVDKYAACVAKSKGDTAKARKCAALLTG